jgi:hypothetical protein
LPTVTLVANSDVFLTGELAVAVTTWLKPTEIGKNTLKFAFPELSIVIEFDVLSSPAT